MLKVCGKSQSVGDFHESWSHLVVDKKRKQVTLSDPSSNDDQSTTSTTADRKLPAAAKKMFAFDAVFDENDSKDDICGTALGDVINAVINGNDGCIFCIGHSNLGKTDTMIGTCDNMGILPTAIFWLFRVISEQKRKNGTKFSLRVSSSDITCNTQRINDLLATYATDLDHPPGGPSFGLGATKQMQSELSVCNIEKAAFYLDAALEKRDKNEPSHFLFTFHVYQYSEANKNGQVAGGRSRLHLLDLANCDRTKNKETIGLSALANVLMAIFNGQKHLPHREHKIVQVMKDCLGSLMCHVTMVAHVSARPQFYNETLSMVQLVSRMHRIRKFKFSNVCNGINPCASELTNSGSDFDPSSSEQSADTVIYVGPSNRQQEEDTDGEHPPVYIPSLNCTDDRTSTTIENIIKRANVDANFNKTISKSLAKNLQAQNAICANPDDVVQNLYRNNNNNNYIKKKVNAADKASSPYHVAKSKLPRTFSGQNSVRSSPLKTNKLSSAARGRVSVGNLDLEEFWIDGPKKDAPKGRPEMWVDGPMKKSSHAEDYGYMDNHKKSMIRKWVENQARHVAKETKFREFTVFKTAPPRDDQEVSDDDNVTRIPETQSDYQISNLVNELENSEINVNKSDESYNEDDIVEIVEIEEYENGERVLMVDCAVQVCEEDIYLCMSALKNEVSSEPLEHPLRILSNENMSVASAFTDWNEFESRTRQLSFPRYQYPTNKHLPENSDANKDQLRFQQLSRLHEIYNNKIRNFPVENSPSEFVRCQSVTMSDILEPEPLSRELDCDNGSIVSEPAYTMGDRGKLCENCRESFFEVENDDFFIAKDRVNFKCGKFRSYRHMRNMFKLRHPDGSSNPNLHMAGAMEIREPGNGAEEDTDSDKSDNIDVPPLRLRSKLLSLTSVRMDNEFSEMENRNFGLKSWNSGGLRNIFSDNSYNKPFSGNYNLANIHTS